MIRQIVFATSDVLLTTSDDDTMAFTRISTGQVLVRLDVDFVIQYFEIMPNGQVVCVGWKGTALLFYPPASIADDVKKHAASIALESTGKPSEKNGSCSFNLGELKTAASDPEALVAMNLDELSSVVSAAMVDFRLDSSQLLSILSKCLGVVFSNNVIYGDMIIDYPHADWAKMITGELSKSDDYVGLGENAIAAFEWRLGRFLKNLRS